jgi:hypothetical protein
LSSDPERVCERYEILVDGFLVEECPIPAIVASTLASRMEYRTAPPQTACLIGHQFKFSVLCNVFPIKERKDSLEQELRSLKQLGVLLEVHTRSSSEQTKGDRTFRFKNVFFVDVMRDRMLEAHIDYTCLFV